jgi:4-amino-4-deoxy-L-arabinose transferase-like glycosyltransferase
VSAAPRASQSLRRWVLGAAALGLALRLGFALFYWVGQPLTRDEREYLSLARSLRAGDGYVYDADLLASGIQPFGRAPGYPVFLAFVGGGASVTTSVPTSVKIAQSVVGALGVLLVAALAYDLAGARAARAAAVIAAIYPPLVWIAAYTFSEALFWPMGLLAAWLVGRATRRPGSGPGAALAAGVVAGAALLVRPMVVLFLPLTVLWFAARRDWFRALAFAAGALVVSTPWAVRTSLSHDRFVPVASEGGITFWTGNNALARGDGDMAANPAIKGAQEALRRANPHLTEEQMEPVYYREAFRWMREHPLDWLVLEMRKVFYLVVPIGPSYTLHSTLYLAGSVVSYGLVLFVAVPGFLGALPRVAETPGLWLLAASSILICLVFFPQERFRVPIVDPTLIVCAGAWAARVRKETAA